MRVLSVTERELRAAARHKGLYHLRWSAAAAALGFLLWLGWAFDVFQNKNTGPEVFRIFAVVLYFYCLLVGAAATADGISRERREGTLGLLFLTNLNSAEILAGKLCAHGLALLYSLVAIFPVLALPLMIGGITPAEFARILLALLNGLLLAVAIGFAVSSVCVRQFPAIALAMGLTLFFGAGLLLLSEGLRELRVPRNITDWIATFCPLHTLFAAREFGRPAGPARFWCSLPAVATLWGGFLLITAWQLNRNWRDRPKRIHRWSSTSLREHLRQRGRNTRAALRRRFLEINPFFWLAGRQRVSAPVFMVLVVLLTLFTVGITAPQFERLLRGGAASPVFGHMFAWLWTGLLIHALVLYYAAHIASQRLAEDKQSGALELILSAPGTESRMARGLWLAYGRRMFFPGLVAVLVHVYFIWLVLTMMVVDPPGRLPPGATQGEIFWSAIFGLPLRGQVLDWEFGMILRPLVLLLVVLMANWVMLGWLGRWLGLRMKHPGFAPMVAVVLAVAPPTLCFSLFCYLAGEAGFFQLREQQVMPLMTWIAVGIALGNCAVWSFWAAQHLRRDFRRTVTSRYEPPLPGAWWRSVRRLLLRVAMVVVVFVLLLAISVASFIGYQNWQSRRQWSAFQKELRQRGESLDLAAMMPGPVADAQNFAKSAAFQRFLSQPTAGNASTRLFRESLNKSAINPNAGPGIAFHATWMQQTLTPLDQHAVWADPQFILGATQDRQKLALSVRDGLAKIDADLDAVAAAAAQLGEFQVSTRRTAETVYASGNRELQALEQLHFLFQIRACAQLALRRGEAAGNDVLTGLRLARLAERSPDLKSSLRVQVMLARSLQPIWEGLTDHRWNENQLAVFQRELSTFDLLAHHTNTIQRAALAHIETWRAIPDSDQSMRSIPQGGGSYLRRRAWDWQPRSWWFVHCIQIHQAGRNACARVDAAAGRVAFDFNWSDLRGLPVDSVTRELFQQSNWWMGNPALVSYAQTAVNQAIVACALERYRLARGNHPESLEQLVPTYLDALPLDFSRGRPVHYQRLASGSYELRGAGYNGIIDGTVPADDWVWAFTTPTNQPPAVRSR